MTEEDLLCECGHRESRHMKGARGEGLDFCMDSDPDEELKMDVSCLCQKFVLKGSVPKAPAEKPKETRTYETEPI